MKSKYFFIMLIISGVFFSPLIVLAMDFPVDSDSDGLTDEQEILFQTDPLKSDTDGDHYPDGEEVLSGYSPTSTSPKAHIPVHLEVNLSNQQLQFVSNGITVKTILVSSGVLSKPTPTGNFKVLRKIAVTRYKGTDYDFKNVKWNMEFKRGYFLHTAYWHKDFGIRPRSHGCINLAEKDAEFLYKYIDVGTSVSVIGKTPVKRLAGI